MQLGGFDRARLEEETVWVVVYEPAEGDLTNLMLCDRRNALSIPPHGSLLCASWLGGSVRNERGAALLPKNRKIL